MLNGYFPYIVKPSIPVYNERASARAKGSYSNLSRVVALGKILIYSSVYWYIKANCGSRSAEQPSSGELETGDENRELCRTSNVIVCDMTIRIPIKSH